MKISGGKIENGIVVGNAYDKYGSKNPIVRWMMTGFRTTLSNFVAKSDPINIHEIGCGEGYWIIDWNHQGMKARGSDFSSQVIQLAQTNAHEAGLPIDIFKQKSIYNIKTESDTADLIVCCEVLEHLEYPEEALQALQRVVSRNIIISVPREPIWRFLNMARGKYLYDMGNTPGHIQHWSRKSFINLVSQYFEIIETKTPFPWIMLLCRAKNIPEDNHG